MRLKLQSIVGHSNKAVLGISCRVELITKDKQACNLSQVSMAEKMADMGWRWESGRKMRGIVRSWGINNSELSGSGRLFSNDKGGRCPSE